MYLVDCVEVVILGVGFDDLFVEFFVGIEIVIVVIEVGIF